MEFNEGFIDTSNSLWEDNFFSEPDADESIVLALESLESPEFEQWQSFDDAAAAIKVEPPFEVLPPSTPEGQLLEIQSVESVVDCGLSHSTQTFVAQDLILGLSQKRRGSGGQWQSIAPNERIRVDKSKGKLVRLDVKCEKANIGEDGWTFQILLVDKARPDTPIQHGDGFTIEVPRPVKGAIDLSSKEFKLKLTKIGKSQYFLVTAKRGNVEFSGMSLEFRSDDNGKVLNPKKRARSEIAPRSSITGLLACRDICADNNLVNLLARSLVPVILDAQYTGGSLEDNIAKRIRLAFNPNPQTSIALRT